MGATGRPAPDAEVNTLVANAMALQRTNAGSTSRFIHDGNLNALSMSMYLHMTPSGGSWSFHRNRLTVFSLEPKMLLSPSFAVLEIASVAGV
jgi:hypothetical protein